MTENLPYYLGFSQFLGIGPIRFNTLIAYFGDVKTAYEAEAEAIGQVIGSTIGKRFADFRNVFDPIAQLDSIHKKQITIITREDKKFPKQLRDLSDAPICLYVKGNVDLINFDEDIFFGIVGTRNPTTYGVQVATIFASELAAAGCTIVSGLALGVDAIAHRKTLEQQGKTIAFLGCGVDIKYPRENAKLYDEIVHHGGLIISEFSPGRTVLKGLFVARNRLISGLSRGIMVVEGLKDSGSLITAKYAAVQGKEVFAPPVPITSRNSEAPNLLLKEGAKLVITVQDILDELNLKAVPKNKNEILRSLSKSEQVVYESLLSEPKLPDDIGLSVSLSISETLSVLSSLEIRGIIENNKEGKYQIKL